jgi:hypothetical protein
VSIDGTAVTQQTGALSVPYSTDDLPAGPHVAAFWARDMAGNVSQVSVPFTVGGPLPTVSRSARVSAGAAIDLLVRAPGVTAVTADVRVLDSDGLLVSHQLVPLRLDAGTAVLHVRAPRGPAGGYAALVRVLGPDGTNSSPYRTLLRARR